MIREAIDRILELGAPNEIEYAGRTFVDKKMTALPHEPRAEVLETNTLSSSVDYIKQRVDEKALPDSRYVIHIQSPSIVALYKEMNADKVRDCLISASFDRCRYQFGQFMDIEKFIINLQSCFVQDENIAQLLSFVASVKDDTSVTQEDDGVTQKVTAKAGISLAKTAKAPNPVYLRPYRTSPEVEQPLSAFVFRMRKDDRTGVTAALFEADGDAWEHAAILNIKQYFDEALPGQAIVLA